MQSAICIYAGDRQSATADVPGRVQERDRVDGAGGGALRRAY